MSNRTRAVLAATVVTVLAACHSQSPPVRLQGATEEIGALAGTWAGTYVGTESGRTGSILFTITPAGDSAKGDVVMTPAAQGPVTAADVSSPVHRMHSQSADALQITFVRVAAGTVEGSLEPYVAPDCKCVVSTVFRGTIKGNAIDGQFTTRGVQGGEQRGTWRVERRR